MPIFTFERLTLKVIDDPVAAPILEIFSPPGPEVVPAEFVYMNEFGFVLSFIDVLPTAELKKALLMVPLFVRVPLGL